MLMEEGVRFSNLHTHTQKKTFPDKATVRCREATLLLFEVSVLLYVNNQRIPRGVLSQPLC